MNAKYGLLLAFFVSSYSISLSAATWKVFFYIDSSDSLSDMAIKNITDMVRGKPGDNIEWLIQLHAYHKAGLRYKVTNQGLLFLEEVTLTGSSKQDFIDAASWAFAQVNADHTMLILANHGWGILDPHWNEETQKWEVGSDALSNSCMVKRSSWQKMHEHHRGFMFSTTPRTYLTSQDLTDSVLYIKNHLLHGTKLDIIAFDTCMGAMLEIAYQLAPSAQYLFGVQSCSLTDGFDYQGVMAALNQGLSPRDLVHSMVKSCDAYFAPRDESGVYTHTALDLSYAAPIVKALDVVVNNLLAEPELAPSMSKAHDSTPRFCMWPMYTDLIAFCKALEEEAKASGLVLSVELQQSLQRLYDLTQSCVVARCGGHTTTGLAHGYAIYLPAATIDESYHTTQFVKESNWITLLKYMCELAK
ncbi:MAG TPA: clostripain-related cysteine peptidase [Candidatus Limnocylindria bacterium]|nr:clostripain-related cysteine peptidase [Candidatus Limnocylindria bacterium]